MMKILLIESDSGDAGLIQTLIHAENPSSQIDWVQSLDSALIRLDQNDYDAVLVDPSLPDSQGVKTIQSVCKHLSQPTVILLVDWRTNEMGLEAMKEGAQDTILIGDVDSEKINKTLRYAIERRKSSEVILNQEKALAFSNKLAALGTMSAGLAHEINTPLASITMLANQLYTRIKEDYPARTDLQKSLAMIEEITFKISKIMKGLRAYARDAQGDPMIHCSLKRIIDDIAPLCANKLGLASVKMTVDPFPDELMIYCRPPQIGQVLINLIQNSVDAIEKLSEKWVRIQVQETDTHIEIKIIDSGKGIPKDVIEKIFDPFFTTKGLGKGTGLGLSISKGIIEGHQGDFFVDHQQPHTCFIIRLPIHRTDMNVS